MKLRLRSAGLLVALAVASSPHFAAEDGSGKTPDGMAAIPAGEFTMGRTFTTSDDETGMRPLILRDDHPAHKVRLDAYWMDSTEVTHAAYAAFLAATGRQAPYHWLEGKMPESLADYPIYNVDWADARSFCDWKGKRLPTEAEWEYAARGGLEAANYPWGDDKPTRDQALYATPAGPQPVGRHAVNAYGLHDMSGSVSEWCGDWFERTYYSAAPAENPQGPSEGMYRIIRGGAWSDGATRITVFFRNWVRPNQRTPNIGFRCVRDMP